MINAFFANLDASSHLANFIQHVAALLETSDHNNDKISPNLIGARVIMFAHF